MNDIDYKKKYLKYKKKYLIHKKYLNEIEGGTLLFSKPHKISVIDNLVELLSKLKSDHEPLYLTINSLICCTYKIASPIKIIATQENIYSSFNNQELSELIQKLVRGLYKSMPNVIKLSDKEKTNIDTIPFIDVYQQLLLLYSGNITTLLRALCEYINKLYDLKLTYTDEYILLESDKEYNDRVSRCLNSIGRDTDIICLQFDNQTELTWELKSLYKIYPQKSNNIYTLIKIIKIIRNTENIPGKKLLIKNITINNITNITDSYIGNIITYNNEKYLILNSNNVNITTKNRLTSYNIIYMGVVKSDLDELFIKAYQKIKSDKGDVILYYPKTD